MAKLPSEWQNWGDVPVGEQNVINSLIDQWEQLSGYAVEVPDWAKMAAAQEGINSLFQMGQYMWRHIYTGTDPGAYFVRPQQVANSPWAAFGMTADAFHAAQNSYDATMQQYTGTGGSWADFWGRMQGSGGQFSSQSLIESLLHDQNTLRTYGWLKYGLTYDQFQQQKQQMKQFFGSNAQLTDQEAVQQLQYLHQGAAASQSASQQLTLTQVEKKSANVGPGQSVVR